MDKKIAGLLGAVAGLAMAGSAQAALSPAANPSETLQASSYADLLAPIPNAVALMKADDAARAQQPNAAPSEDVQVAQRYPFYHHHHHHHHHSYYGYYRRYHHHHHHHHHRGAFIRIPGFGGVVINRGFYGR
ncbi:MAG TPA: hypothetical protein VJ770_18850 [Stellaceae bacterium]|nr:hypothetical protein [Stellaceae bacterium]